MIRGFILLCLFASGIANGNTFRDGVDLKEDKCSLNHSNRKLYLDDFMSYVTRTKLIASVFGGKYYDCDFDVPDASKHNIVAIPMNLLNELEGYRDEGNMQSIQKMPANKLCGMGVNVTYGGVTKTAVIGDQCKACKVPNWGGYTIDPKEINNDNCERPVGIRHMDINHHLRKELGMGKDLYEVSVKFLMDENKGPIYLLKTKSDS